MGYRVYDKKKKSFVKDNVYLTPDGELVETKKSLFGNKMTFIDQDRYIFQQAIELPDKDGKEIYIGDILEANVANDEVVRGVVTFAEEISSYIILCFDRDEFFTLGRDVCEFIKVIGNVFDEQ